MPRNHTKRTEHTGRAGTAWWIDDIRFGGLTGTPPIPKPGEVQTWSFVLYTHAFMSGPERPPDDPQAHLDEYEALLERATDAGHYVGDQTPRGTPKYYLQTTDDLLVRLEPEQPRPYGLGAWGVLDSIEHSQASRPDVMVQVDVSMFVLAPLDEHDDRAAAEAAHLDASTP